MDINADVVVVGGGATGLGAARTARRRGASVALIERDRLGGDCTWTGCVPSKALLERAREVWGGRRQGLTGAVDGARILTELRAARVDIAQDESRETLEAEGIRVVPGQAAFISARRLAVDGATVTARRAVIVATGAHPVLPPIPGLAHAQPRTSDTIFELEDLPPRLAVIGGGPIGMELAQAFCRLGTEVTVIARQVLGKEEPEAGEVVGRVLAAEGVRLLSNAAVAEVSSSAGVTTLGIDDGRQVTAEVVLVATGRRPVTEGLDLERIGVQTDDRGAVVTDARLQTAVRGVYAAGDVTNLLPFTHAGDQMAGIAVGNALGRLDSRFDSRAIPWATFTDPEVGRVGMTEQQASEAHGAAARVAYLPLADTDRGRASGRTEGFVKLIAGPRGLLGSLAGGRLLGATVVAPTGADVVHEVAVLMRAGAFTGRLAQTVHTYPAWSLAVRECAAQFFFEYKHRRARPARRS